MQWKNGRYDDAQNTVLTAARLIQNLRGFDLAYSLPELAQAQARMGIKEQASETLEQAYALAQSDDFQTDIDKELVSKTFAALGEIAEARKFMPRAAGLGYCSALAGIATAEAKAGMKERSLSTLDEAKVALRRISNDDELRADCQFDIIRTEAELGTVTHALKLLDKYSVSEKTPYRVVEALCLIAKALPA